MMISAYILVYLLNGTRVLEPIGVSGADWEECQSFAVQAAIDRKNFYKDARYIVPYCTANVEPKP